jgi:CRISPR-associated protein Csm1
LAGLLHDLGKFQQRGFAERTVPHEEYSRRFVEEDLGGYFRPCGDDLAHAITHHHRRVRASREAEKLVILADWLSANERENEEREREEPAHAALLALLTRPPIAPEGTPERRFPLGRMDWNTEAGFFPAEQVAVGPEDYARVWQQFRDEFSRLAGQRGYRSADLTTITALLRKYTTRMPSATPWQKAGERTVPDISLYSHLKTTAAVASCLEAQLGPDEPDRLLAALTTGRAEDVLSTPLCALVKGDISGTQDFLYLLTSKGAARGLRGRSFYLQLLTETIAWWFLRQLDLPPTNLLLAAGGHFYLLLPYRRAEEKLPELRRRLAGKLWQAHQGDLSLTVGWVSVAAHDFRESADGGHAFAAKWDEVSREVNARKQQKWRDLGDPAYCEYLFAPVERGGIERICDVCRNEGDLQVEDDTARCQRCRSFEDLGRQLRQPRFLVLFDIEEAEPAANPAWQDVLRSFGVEAALCDGLDEIQPPSSARAARVYRLDDAGFLSEVPASWGDLPVGFDFRWLANATPRKDEGNIAEFGDLARASRGVKWLGVLRIDVDNLGQLFRERLGAAGTLSRMSTLSEELRLFFEAWVPLRCRQRNLYPHGADAVYLTYAGGDDLFLVGGWSVLPELAQQIREDFRRFVGGDHVTLSAGIAIEHAKYPLYQLAEDAKQSLDDQAKTYRRSGGRAKDAVCFMGMPMGWERLAEVAQWKNELLQLLDPPAGVQPLPQGFLTRLSEIHAVYAVNAALRHRLHRRGEINHEQMAELIQYDRWQWRLVYQLGRFRERYPHCAEPIGRLRQAIAQERDGLICVLRVLARWAALLTREGDNDATR